MTIRPLVSALRFASVGAANTILGLGTIIFAQELIGLSEYLANAAGFAVGLCVGFAGNFLWSFESRQAAFPTALRYLAAFVPSYLANLSVLATLLDHTALPSVMAQIAAVAFYTMCFFLLCRYVVFKE